MGVDVECVVVGAGVVGLAIARALGKAGRDVLVLEQHRLIGAETSSRNSEVIHAGIYYAPGSLRARFCVEGKALLYQFCADNGVDCKRYGKLLVATRDAELQHLAAIGVKARKNGVRDLRSLTREDAIAMEPQLECVAATLSPSTGVIDTHGLMAALEGHITSHGGQVVLATRVTGIELASNGAFRLTSTSDGAGSTISCHKLVLAAGLHGSKLGRMITYPGSYHPPATYPAKGHYFTLTGKAPFSRLVYPIPSDGWLGIHQTIDLAGQTKFGPDLEWVQEPAGGTVKPAALDYGFEDEAKRLAIFAREISRYYPALDAADLQPGYTGIRPKIYREGEPVPDFTIAARDTHGIDGLVALYGIESPGLTSCLAIGEYVAKRI